MRRRTILGLATLGLLCGGGAIVHCSRDVRTVTVPREFAIELTTDVVYGPTGARFPLRVRVTPSMPDVVFSWSVSAGQIVGEGAQPIWQSPATPQAALVWVTAERGSIRRVAGLRITTFDRPSSAPAPVSIPPAKESDEPPLDLTISMSKSRICRGETTVLRATARNADEASSAEIHYLWDLTIGEDAAFARSGPGLAYTAPAQAPPGKVNVRLRASNAATAMHALEVDEGPPGFPLAMATASFEIADCALKDLGLAIATEVRPVAEARFDVYDLAAMTADPAGTGDPYEYLDSETLRSVTRFEWDFGDGAAKVTTPVGRVTHVYHPSDTHARHFYTVTLRMTRTDGVVFERVVPVDLQLYKPSLKSCAFASSLVAAKRRDKETTVDVLLQNVSGAIANFQSIDLTRGDSDDAVHTFSTQSLTDTSLAPGYATSATVTVPDSDFGSDNLVQLRLRATTPDGEACVGYLRLAAFEGEVLELANRTPSFAEQAVPGGSKAFDEKLARWKATQKNFAVTEDQVGPPVTAQSNEP